MARWDYTLHLKDIFHNEDMTFEQRRDAIVRRIRLGKFFPDPIQSPYEYDDFDEIVCLLQEASTEHIFNYEWDSFYDWCDDNRVWVETI